MAVKIPESGIQNSIIQYLRLHGHFVHRQNAGAFKNSIGGFYRMSMKGASDIVGVSKSGVAIAIEVKTAGGEPTNEQLDYLNEFSSRGGYGFIARSIDDVIARGL